MVKGYAEVMLSTNAAVNQVVWYLSHLPVFNANKVGKIRVVFDCSAKCYGVSLNDVSQELDLANKLAVVLLRFRQR